MSETNQATVGDGASVTNLAGGAMLVIMLALASVIWFQQTQLSEAVKTLAVVSAKCAKK